MLSWDRLAHSSLHSRVSNVFICVSLLQGVCKIYCVCIYLINKGQGKFDGYWINKGVEITLTMDICIYEDSIIYVNKQYKLYMSLHTITYVYYYHSS